MDYDYKFWKYMVLATSGALLVGGAILYFLPFWPSMGFMWGVMLHKPVDKLGTKWCKFCFDLTHGKDNNEKE